MATITFKCETAGDSFKGFLQKGADGPIRELPFIGTSKKGKSQQEITPGKYRFVMVTIGPPQASFKADIDGATPAVKTLEGKITAKFIGGGARVFHVTSLLLALFLGFAFDAQAQAQLQTQLEAERIANETQKTLADPSLESPFLAPAEAIKVEVSRENKTAAAVISKGELWHFKVSAPIGEGADELKLATLRGLAGAAKINFGAKIKLTDWVPVFNVQELAACGDECLFTDENVEKIVTLKGMKSLIATQVEFARPKLEYFDTTTLATLSETHPQYAGTIAYGILPLRRGVYFASIGYRYESSYEPKPKKEVCRPISETNGTECSSKSFGAPEHSLKRAAELESRIFLGKHRSVAVAPLIAYEFGNSALGIDVPFYFFMGKEGLDGGIRFGWRSDTEEFTASLFVGAMGELFD